MIFYCKTVRILRMSEHVLKLPFELNTASGGSRQPAVTREHGAEWNQFIWVKSGCGVFSIRDEAFELCQGMGMFMRHDVPCCYYGDDLHTAWISFYCDETLLSYTVGSAEYIIFNVPSFLQRETEAITALAKGNSTTLELSASGYTLVTSLFSEITKQGESVTARLRDLLYERYSEPLTLDVISSEIGLDRFSLCHKIKEEIGSSVMKELCAIRITKAKRMLRYTDEPIESIGRQVGFESHSYFTKRFRELCGCSPKEYRYSFFRK